MSRSMSAVERWDYSRRFQVGTCTDIVWDEFVIVDEYGHKKLAKLGRGLDKLTIMDFLPVKVMYKYTGKDYVIIDYEIMDHPSLGEQKEQMELDTWS